MCNGVSIICCLHNSSKKLERSLVAISNLVLPKGIDVELVCVDNCSSDGSMTAAARIWDSLEAPFELRVLEQPIAGQAFARKTGVISARYDVVLFCDDDNVLDRDYLAQVSDFFIRHPKAGVVGGCSTPLADVDLPAWFYRYATKLAVGSQALKTGDVTDSRMFVWGAGLACRKPVLEKLYTEVGLPLLTGRAGKSLSSGDDVEICLWFTLAGYQVWYQDDLHLRHYMPPERLTKEYLNKWIGHSDTETLRVLFAFVCLMRWRFCLRGGMVDIVRHHLRPLRDLLIIASNPKFSLSLISRYRDLARIRD